MIGKQAARALDLIQGIEVCKQPGADFWRSLVTRIIVDLDEIADGQVKPVADLLQQMWDRLPEREKPPPPWPPDLGTLRVITADLEGYIDRRAQEIPAHGEARPPGSPLAAHPRRTYPSAAAHAMTDRKPCGCGGYHHQLSGRRLTPAEMNAMADMFRAPAGSAYLERGHPVTVLKRWAKMPAVAASAVIWHLPPKPGGPRNVLIERADGSKVVRPFRGLRKPKDGANDEA